MGYDASMGSGFVLPISRATGSVRRCDGVSMSPTPSATARAWPGVPVFETLPREVIARQRCLIGVAAADVGKICVVVGGADDSPNETGCTSNAGEKRGTERGGPPPNFNTRCGIARRVTKSTRVGPWRRTLDHLLPPPTIAFAGRCFSNNSKMRRYSSAHDDGRTNPWSSTG